MNWANEPWRKLYCRITGEFGQLSATARCMSSELIKYASDTGMVCKTRGKAPALAVALVVNPQPHELESFERAAGELLDDDFLRVIDGAVWMKNFTPAQERKTAVANRVARHRERKKREQQQNGNSDMKQQGVTDVTDDETSSETGSETDGNDETKRNDPKRNETRGDPPTPDLERVKKFSGVWTKSGLPPNGNLYELSLLLAEIDLAEAAATQAGQQIPSPHALMAELKAIADKQTKDGLTPSYKPSKLAGFVGQAIMSIRKRAGISTTGDFARALAKSRGD